MKLGSRKLQVKVCASIEICKLGLGKDTSVTHFDTSQQTHLCFASEMIPQKTSADKHIHIALTAATILTFPFKFKNWFQYRKVKVGFSFALGWVASS